MRAYGIALLVLALVCGGGTAVAQGQAEPQVMSVPVDGLIPMGPEKIYAGIAGDRAMTASFRVRLAEMSEGAEGALFLRYSLRAKGVDGQPVQVSVRVPLASTDEAYGEERSCTVNAAGVREMVFTAGLDEANFMPFRTAGQQRAFSFSLNKYLCRVLATPFRCGDQSVRLPQTMGAWTVAEQRDVVLHSKSDAQMEGQPVEVSVGGRFDAAQCAVIAPSNGMCCVGGKSTEWHCGGTPVGAGWHQVSGECFHRETGGSCTE